MSPILLGAHILLLKVGHSRQQRQRALTALGIRHEGGNGLAHPILVDLFAQLLDLGAQLLYLGVSLIHLGLHVQDAHNASKVDALVGQTTDEVEPLDIGL